MRVRSFDDESSGDNGVCILRSACVSTDVVGVVKKNVCSYAVERDKAFRSVGCLLGRVRESSSAARPASETQPPQKKHEIQIDLRQVVASCKGLSSCLTSVEVKRSELDDIYVLLKRCILQDIICQKLKTIVDNCWQNCRTPCFETFSSSGLRAGGAAVHGELLLGAPRRTHG